ncbi:MAG: aminotransferase class I/II-fold pyridoxal phosphate-dependent enzyme [Candidatus Micrarchaeota archaeon]|nr:aminotransferase class I/II-fold pyridoxal phosphate-dependent enzyme [Candidatus Micrarchaeota archaeon]
MVEVSERVRNIGFSPMRKLLPFAEKAKSEGVQIFHLNIGQPDIPTPTPYFDALKRYDGADSNRVDEYVKSQGLDELRKAFVEYTKLTVEGIDDMTIDNCLITEGGSEALSNLSYVLFEPGDKIVVPEPFYANYNTFMGVNDVEIVPCTTDIRENFSLRNIVSEIKRIVSEDKKVKGILITNPGNPTGGVYTAEELDEIARIVKDNDLWLIADEVYREIVFDGENPRSVLSIKSIRENTIVVDSVSKKWSACGARVGAIFTYNESVLENFLKLLQSRLSASRVNQEASAAMIDADVSILKKRANGHNEPTSVELARDEYSRRRKAAYEILKKHGILCGYPKGALYLIAEIGEKDGIPIDAEDFCRFMLEEFRVDGKTVMVTAAESFYKTPGKGKNQIRLAFVLNEEKTKEATEILCKGIEAYKNK